MRRMRPMRRRMATIAALAVLPFCIATPLQGAVQEEVLPKPPEALGVAEQELIRYEGWHAKTRPELERDLQILRNDLQLMEQRLNQLRGTTRMNQDQYREKEILERLILRKKEESATLEKFLADFGLAPDFTLPATTGGDISLHEFSGRQHVLLIFYLFDFSPT